MWKMINSFLSVSLPEFSKFSDSLILWYFSKVTMETTNSYLYNKTFEKYQRIRESENLENQGFIIPKK